jgi:aminopeptidase N
MKTASNGTRVESTDNGTIAVTRWRERYPIATYLVSVTSFAYTTYSDWYRYTATDSMEIQFYLFPEDNTPGMAAVSAKVKGMLAAYAARFGPYPFLNEKYGHAEFPWGGGMEHQTCTSLGAFAEAVVAHELGHQWWGDGVTCRDFHHVWLNEGFATYCEALWAEAIGGVALSTQRMLDYERYYGPGTIYCPDLTDVGRIFDNDLSYRKPSWVLHMLRHVMGDTTFFTALRTYRQQFPYGTAVTEDLQQVCENVSGRSLERFFQEWIYGEYFPQYAVQYFSAPGGGGYDVTLQLQQVQSWQLFWMPVDVTIHTPSGDTTFVVQDSLATQTFTFHVSAAPISVLIDKNGWILQQTVSPLAVDPPALAAPLRLLPPAPNPTPRGAAITFSLPRAGETRVALVDAAGRRVAELRRGPLPAGQHHVEWDGRDGNGRLVAGGIYWVSVEYEGTRLTRKLAVVR